MAVNKNALIRYKTLDKCFSNPYRKFYLEDLIEKCNEILSDHYGEETTVSRRQIFLDIQFMKSDAGYEAPIESLKDGRKVYYKYDDPDFTIERKPFTNDERLTIENTIELFSRIKGIPGFDAIESIKTKLTEVKDSQSENNIIDFEENEFLIGIEHLTPLYNYIKNKQVLLVAYQSFKSNELQEFFISPYYLKQYNNRWFLFGWNHKGEYIQNLALDRIQSIESINEQYNKSNIDFTEYFEDIIGVTNPLDKEVVQVKIQLSDNIIPYIKSKPIHGSQKIVDNILNLNVKLNYELESVILSYGENMKVLEPIELINNLKQRINQLKDFY
ncbi:WYL domain-containing protein [Empedobacter falsenii]|uniref:WYL domain-containing protein n=1 Tax=Empedobacter falsenii TaxID=343874 RepID=A0ABY8VF92_9FLAO|nr:WYL domain-containing protein [Empedobacter falsenii]WIH98215.1 WYL domain-containing protein [Empedobacter falsenii]